MKKESYDHHEDHFILPRKKKLAYGLGGIPYMLFTSGAAQISMIFNVVFKLDALLVGMIFIIPRVWDAISDPLMGNISDNTRSKWGRRRPYILWGGIACGMLYFFMLTPPASWVRPLTDAQYTISTAATANGVSVTNIEDGLKHLENSLEEADNGGSTKLDDFATLGLMHDKLADQDSNERLLEVVTAIAGVEEATERTRLAVNMLGQTGSELLPLLNKGTEEFKSVLAEIQKPYVNRMTGFLIVTSILFFTAFTVFVVPYFALGMEMSMDYHERTRIQGYREFFASFGVIIAYWALWFITRPFFPSDVVGARYFGLLVAAVAAITIIALFRGTSEEAEIQKQEKIGFIEAIKFTLSNRQFLLLSAAILCFQLGLIVWVALQAYVNLYYVFDGDLEKGSYMVGVNATSFHIAKLFVVAPMIWIGTKIGKGRTFSIGIVLTFIALALTWVAYTPDHPYWQLALQMILVWCLPTAEIFPNSITADICDLDELKTGRRREGVFGACLAFARKTGFAAVPLVVGVGLSLSGFDANLGSQPEEVLTKMRLVTIIIPVLFVALSGILFYAVRIPEEQIRETRRILEQRRREQKA